MSKPIKKPKCKLVGTDGNIFALIGQARLALKRAKLPEQAKEMSERCMRASTYDEAILIICEYVDVH